MIDKRKVDATKWSYDASRKTVNVSLSNCRLDKKYVVSLKY